MLFDNFGRSVAPTAQFAHVTPAGRHPPPWLAAHSRGLAGGNPDATALKPARIPDDLSPVKSSISSRPPLPYAAQPPVQRPATPPPPAPPPEAIEPDPTPLPPAVQAPPEPAGPDPEATAAFFHAAEQFQRAAQELAQTRSAVMAQTEEQLVTLASTIARRVVGNELIMRPDIVLGLAREGMAALGDHDRLTIRVGRGFGEALSLLETELGSRNSDFKVSVDPNLADYGCTVETQFGKVDESVEHRLDRVLAALVPDDDSRD